MTEMGLLALLAVAGLGVAAAFVLRRMMPGAPARRLASRLAGVARGQAAAQAARRPALRRLRQHKALLPRNLGQHAAKVFGWVPERRHQYPAPPAVLMGAVALLLLLAGLQAAAMLGAWAHLLLPGIWVVLSRGLFGMIHARRADAMYRQLPDALSMVVRSVRAGIPVSQALRGVGKEVADPTGAEFRRLADQLSIGIDMDPALAELARRSGLPEYGFLKVALSLQNAAGGNLTETLENLAEVVRKRLATRTRGMALASQARASANILAAVPVVAALALLAINPDYIAILVVDSRGQVILALAVTSLVIGLGTMRLIIKRSLA